MDRPSSTATSLLSQEKIEKIGSFLGRCVKIDRFSFCTNEHDKVVVVTGPFLQTINNHIPSLKQVEITGFHQGEDANMVVDFMRRHVRTVKEVELDDCPECFDKMIFLLHSEEVYLQSLRLTMVYKSELTDANIETGLNSSHQRIMDYIESCGRDLTYFQVLQLYPYVTVTNEVLDLILKSCPNMHTLSLTSMGDDGGDPMGNPTQPISLASLYRSLPAQVKTVKLDQASLYIDRGNHKVVAVTSRRCLLDSEWVDWIDSLGRYIMKDGDQLAFHAQCVRASNAILSLLVDRLKDYLVELSLKASDLDCDTFERLLKECSHLESLSIAVGAGFSDNHLQAVALYRPMLTALRIEDCTRPIYTDHGISEMIASCLSLMELDIPYAGCESLAAAMQLPKLTNFTFQQFIDSSEDVISFFLDDSVKWLTSLKKGWIEMMEKRLDETFDEIEEDVEEQNEDMEVSILLMSDTKERRLVLHRDGEEGISLEVPAASSHW